MNRISIKESRVYGFTQAVLNSGICIVTSAEENPARLGIPTDAT
jgi:hypothetical protein